MSAVELLSAAVTGGVSRITPEVWRLVAPNPSPLTGPGTNTYVVGASARVVIDPGPDDPGHIDAILAVAGGHVEQVLCTHSHPDHSPGAVALKARTGAIVRGLPAPRDEHQDLSYAPDLGFEEAERIRAGGCVLRAVHTPGHASNHVCFLLESEGLLFTGDHLMNGSTVVILPPDGSMRLYVESLRRLLTLPVTALAPGHGAVIPQAHADIERVIAHRLKREEKLIRALAPRGRATLRDVLAEVYDDVPQSLHEWAMQSLHAHAIKLEEEGRAMRQGDAWTWVGG